MKRNLLLALAAFTLAAAPVVAQEEEAVPTYPGSVAWLGVNFGTLIDDGTATNALTGTAMYEFEEGLVIEYELGGTDLAGDDPASADYTKIGWKFNLGASEFPVTRLVFGMQRTDLDQSPLYGLFGGVMHDLNDEIMYRVLFDVTDTEEEGVEVGAKVGFFLRVLES